MNYPSSISAINSLIEINNDRIEGYATAAVETDEEDLKTIFHQLAETSRKFNSELVFEVNKLNGTPIEGTSTIGKFFRVWMDMKTALTQHDRKFILESCAYGEEIALEAYGIALSRDLKDLSLEIQGIVQQQKEILKKDSDKINLMVKQLESLD